MSALIDIRPSPRLMSFSSNKLACSRLKDSKESGSRKVIARKLHGGWGETD